MTPIPFFSEKNLVTYDLGVLYEDTVEYLNAQKAVFFTPEAFLEKIIALLFVLQHEDRFVQLVVLQFSFR